jgi:glyoxylase I family protein
MTDGSCIAFFDLGDDVASQPSPNTPDWVNHIAFRVDSVAHLEQVKARLEAHGIEVVGVTDHHIFKSIYFFDPNGIRVELSAQLASEMQMLEESRHAHSRLAEWTRRKNEWRKERAAGNGPAVLKPQQNDRPEVAERAARTGSTPR